MEHEKLSYPEALRWLAGKYGIEIEERKLTPEELEEQTERESLSNLSAWAQKWYSDSCLKQAKEKAWAWAISAAGIYRCHHRRLRIGLLSRTAVVRGGRVGCGRA